MPSSEDIIESRPPTLAGRGPAGTTSRSGAGSGRGGDTWLAIPTPDNDHEIQKRLLKQKLFSRRAAAPVTFGRFTVLEVLGQGGMGIVYACFDDQLERKVAVKVLLGKHLQDTELGRSRLLREAQAMARLSHSNIVTVLEVGAFEDQLYVAMEFIPGTSLDVWLEQEPRPWQSVVAAFLQAGRGLEAAHRAGIVHRDFKPQNAIITADGLVKVLDFGLARASEEAMQDLLASVSDSAGETESRALLRSLTRTGAHLGTPAYMSPEQHRGERATAASDQFSFCVSLYLGLYGHHPFSVHSLAELRRDVEAGAVAAVPPRTPVPPHLYRLLRRGLAVDPRARFASMTELLAELARDPRATLRRFAITAAVAGCVGVASFSAAGAYTPAAAFCPDAGAELAGIWDLTRQTELQVALAATGSPYAAETWTIIEPQLTSYAADWSAMRNEACQTHAEARQSDPLFDLRTACLDQRRAGFAGLIDSLTALDIKTLDTVIPAVGQLPSLTACADVEALTAAIPLPEDPAARAQVLSLRESLARARAQENAGRYREGLATVTAVRERALELGYEPLLAETLLRLGSLQMEAGEAAAADASFGEALLTGLAVDHKEVAAQALSKQVFVRASGLGRAAEAVDELPLAQALNVHVEGDLDLHSEFLNNLGVVHSRASDFSRARSALESALALRDQNGQEHTLLSLNILGNLTTLAYRQNDTLAQVALSRQLVARSGAVLGEHHPRHIQFMTSLAQALIAVGRPGEARGLLDRVEPELAGIESGQLRGWILLVLGDLARGGMDHEERDLAAARRHYQAVIDEGSAPGLVSTAKLRLGAVAAQEGREAEMRAHFDALLTATPQRPGAEDWGHLSNKNVFASALIDLGRAAEASEQLEHVRTRCAEPGLSPQQADICGHGRYQLGGAYLQLGDFAAAEQVLTQQLQAAELSLAANPLGLMMVKRSLAEAVLGQRRFDEAAARLRELEAAYVAMVEPDYVPLARTRFALARALTGDRPALPADAAALAEQALTVYRAKGPAFAGEALAVANFMARPPAP